MLCENKTHLKAFSMKFGFPSFLLIPRLNRHLNEEGFSRYFELPHHRYFRRLTNYLSMHSRRIIWASLLGIFILKFKQYFVKRLSRVVRSTKYRRILLLFNLIVCESFAFRVNQNTTQCSTHTRNFVIFRSPSSNFRSRQLVPCYFLRLRCRDVGRNVSPSNSTIVLVLV